MSTEDECMCDAEKAVDKKLDKKDKKDKKAEGSVLSQSIYDKKVLSPADLAKLNEADKPKGIVSKCSGTQPFKLEDMEIGKVLVEYRMKEKKIVPKPKEDKKILEPPKRLSVCDSLKLAGFQTDWTKEKVSNMLKTPDGAEIIKRVDMEYRKLSGKSSLQEKDILSCYPNYLKREKRKVELMVELDGNDNILSVKEGKLDKEKKKDLSKFKL
jgi:hypothetical protein